MIEDTTFRSVLFLFLFIFDDYMFTNKTLFIGKCLLLMKHILQQNYFKLIQQALYDTWNVHFFDVAISSRAFNSAEKKNFYLIILIIKCF